MIRMIRVLSIVLLAGALPSAAAAQDWLAKRVSLDLKAMAPAEAFQVLADAVGAKATVDPSVTTAVDIVVRNVSARTALNTICESIGCRWTADAAAITVMPEAANRLKIKRVEKTRSIPPRAGTDRLRALLKQPLPAGMKFENAPLSTISTRFSEALGVGISITAKDPPVQTASGDFSHLTLQDAIRVLSDSTGSQSATWHVEIRLGEKAAVLTVVSKTMKKK